MNISVEWNYPYNDTRCCIKSGNANLNINVNNKTKQHVYLLVTFCYQYVLSTNINDINEIIVFIRKNSEFDFLVKNNAHKFLVNNINLIIRCVNKTFVQNIGV